MECIRNAWKTAKKQVGRILPLKGLKTVFQGMTSGIVLFTIINRCIYVHRRIFNCNGMSASDSQIYRFKSIALNNCANKLPVTYLYRCLTWVRRRKYDTLKRGSRWHARIAEVVYPQTYTHIYIYTRNFRFSHQELSSGMLFSKTS